MVQPPEPNKAGLILDKKGSTRTRKRNQRRKAKISPPTFIYEPPEPVYLSEKVLELYNGPSGEKLLEAMKDIIYENTLEPFDDLLYTFTCCTKRPA